LLVEMRRRQAYRSVIHQGFDALFTLFTRKTGHDPVEDAHG